MQVAKQSWSYSRRYYYFKRFEKNLSRLVHPGLKVLVIRLSLKLNIQFLIAVPPFHFFDLYLAE